MDEARLRKLRFRAWRRGFKEADMVLGNFADQHLDKLDTGQLDKFEALLDVPDQELFPWLIGRERPPLEHDHDVMELIQSFSRFAHALVQQGATSAHGRD